MSIGITDMSISITDYLLLSAAVTGAALLASAALKKPAPAKEPQLETSRWRRFLVSASALHKALVEPCAAVLEEPSGLKLLVAPRESPESRHWRIIDTGGQPVAEMLRGLFLFHRRLRVVLQGKRWLQVLVPRPNQKKTALFFMSPTDACEVQGNLAAREFEIRKKGRLIATVSWQRPEGDALPRKDYVLEVVRTEDALPVIALVLGIEAAFGPAR